MPKFSLQFFKPLAAHTILIGVIVVILFTIISLVLNSITRHGESLSVPNITGLKMEAAVDVLNQKNLKYIISDSLFFEDKPKNSVLDQNPSPQSKVKEGRIVYITLNAMAAPMVNVPNLIDVSLRQATVMLQSVGLKAGRLMYKPDIAKNVVLELVYNNEKITPQSRIPKGSTVDLVLGDGLSGGETSLPDLVGLTLEEANNLLASSSLAVGSVVFIGPISDSASARIVKQNPPYADGVMVGSGQPVDLFLNQK